MFLTLLNMNYVFIDETYIWKYPHNIKSWIHKKEHIKFSNLGNTNLKLSCIAAIDQFGVLGKYSIIINVIY